MTFRRFLTMLSISLAVVGGPVAAGDLEDGAAAIENKDYKTARKLLTPLAQQGNRDAQRIMGLMYMYELGVNRDYLKADAQMQAAMSPADKAAMQADPQAADLDNKVRAYCKANPKAPASEAMAKAMQ